MSAWRIPGSLWWFGLMERSQTETAMETPRWGKVAPFERFESSDARLAERDIEEHWRHGGQFAAGCRERRRAGIRTSGGRPFQGLVVPGTVRLSSVRLTKGEGSVFGRSQAARLGWVSPIAMIPLSVCKTWFLQPRLFASTNSSI